MPLHVPLFRCRPPGQYNYIEEYERNNLTTVQPMQTYKPLSPTTNQYDTVAIRWVRSTGTLHLHLNCLKGWHISMSTPFVPGWDQKKAKGKTSERQRKTEHPKWHRPAYLHVQNIWHLTIKTLLLDYTKCRLLSEVGKVISVKSPIKAWALSWLFSMDGAFHPQLIVIIAITIALVYRIRKQFSNLSYSLYVQVS